jgi:hypothetical protein
LRFIGKITLAQAGECSPAGCQTVAGKSFRAGEPHPGVEAPQGFLWQVLYTLGFSPPVPKGALNDSVKRFNANAVIGIDTDLKMFEAFAENMSTLFVDSDQESVKNEMKAALVEVRQLVNLLMNNSPENFLNPVIREKNYSKLDYKKVAAISEKFRDSSESYFSTFGTRGAWQNPKKKSLDTLIKRLREAS